MFEVTPSEAAVLGLLAERPMHGYELDEVIEQRGLRAWTEIGFSSIYFHLQKLEKKGLVRQQGSPSSLKSRKAFEITAEGRQSLHAACLKFIAESAAKPPSVLVALANWPVLDKAEALAALEARRDRIAADLHALRKTWAAQAPLPSFVDTLFSYSVTQAEAELVWISSAIEMLGGADG